MALLKKFGVEDVSPYQVRSRREIVGLLRGVQQRNQLVSIQAEGSGETVVTSILQLDEEAGLMVIDRAQNDVVNQGILASDNISFETFLDNIRILFFAHQMRECLYENLPALCIAIPESLIRLQRRENFRVPTPITNPVRCTIRVTPDDADTGGTNIVVTLKDISGGGIAIIDEKKLLDNTIGRIYKGCRLELPGGNVVTITLQVRNSHDISLATGKSIRKLGCMFVDLDRPTEASIQRYITRLERERNAKATGMG